MQTKMYPLKNAQGKVESYDLSSAFPILQCHHPFVRDVADTAETMRRMGDLVRKIPFPYNGLTGPEVWDKAPVLPKELYFDDFAQKGISDDDYSFTHGVAAKCEMQTFRDYHDCYLSTDILALADVF